MHGAGRQIFFIGSRKQNISHVFRLIASAFLTLFDDQTNGEKQSVIRSIKVFTTSIYRRCLFFCLCIFLSKSSQWSNV